MRVIVAGLLAMYFELPGSFAAVITWSGAAGNGDWFTTNNWVGNAVPTNTDDVLITNCPGIAVLTNSTTVRSLVLSNETLSFSNWNTTLTVSNDIGLYGTAVITHPTNSATASPWNPDNGIFLVCSSLTVSAGSSINGNGAGYKGGGTYANGQGPGRGYYYGTWWGSGGGYGGNGGVYAGASSLGGLTYGTASNPAAPGSGGGGTSTTLGGGGGGYVSIVATGTVVVDGVITMNGASISGSAGGGGSGGGILMSCGSLLGAGTICANGANKGASQGSGGGGGRIAISVAGSSSFSGQISAAYGTTEAYSFPDATNRYCSLPGTIYFSDWRLLPSVLTNGGPARFTAPTGMISSLTISNYTLCLEWGWETNRLRAGTVSVLNGGKIMSVWNTATATNAAGGWDADGGVFIECSNLTVAGGGEINVSGMGYRGKVAGNGYGPGKGWYAAGYYGGGGGYGGNGGMGWPSSSGGAVYDAATNPASPGSAGGGTDSVAGYNGGGYVKIVAASTVAVDGVITANGNNGSGAEGGGSGGGIFLQCGALCGNGSILANGGSPALTGAGGGGGGRIAILASGAGSFSGQLSAAQGAGYYTFPDIYRVSPQPGTIYLSDWCLLPAFLTNGGAARFTASTGMAASVTISNYTLCLEWGWETNRLRAGSVTVQNNGKIRSLWNTATTTNLAGGWDANGGVFIECSNLTVAGGGTINCNRMGFNGGSASGNGYGPGKGLTGTWGGSGGGYGGTGCVGNSGSGAGVTYGSIAAPDLPGSGGGGTTGGGSPSPGAPGGGYVKIVASGTVNVNGIISVNGSDAADLGSLNAGGGGSGGGIYLQCWNLIGTGTICAAGGSGYGSTAGGGGGGGRIALIVYHAPYYSGGNLLFTPRPPGGSGYNNATGGVGTIYLYYRPRGTVWCAW